MKPLNEHWKTLGIDAPRLQIVLGSGLAGAFAHGGAPAGWQDKGELAFAQVKGLIPSSAPGHKGAYRFFRHEKSGKSICFQVGRLHGYEGLNPREVVKPVMIPFEAGTPKFLLTNAAGSLDPSFKVGSLMIIRDHVNMTGTNPLWGPNPLREDGTPLGFRFPDMTRVYDEGMRTRLQKTLLDSKEGFSLVEGTYLGLSGPTYETPAEVKLFSSWGLGSVGMSTVWEAIALTHAKATLAGLSFISNLGAGLGAAPLHHEDVEKEAAKIALKLVRALFDYAALEV